MQREAPEADNQNVTNWLMAAAYLVWKHSGDMLEQVTI